MSDLPCLSIIVASSGRPTLARTLESVRSQMVEGDEILVSVNSNAPWGHAARNQLMLAASGDYLLFMDDDDVYTSDALAAVRRAVAGCGHDAVHLFRMQYADGALLWADREVRCGNVSTQMIAVPAFAPMFPGCRWGNRYEGDFDFISACSGHLPVEWHEDVIAFIRPKEPA